MDLAGLFITDDGVARLTGSRCESCGAIAFPARQVCGQCGSRDQSTATLAGSGIVVSTTHVVTPPAGFDQPIDVALIDLAEGPRLFALLTAPALVGTSVQAVPFKVRGGDSGFAFEAQSTPGARGPHAQ
ncbi:MAG: Zn-ribbon domain-containing OB-fold protein [Candidatus Dormibacteraceae bacterium]